METIEYLSEQDQDWDEYDYSMYSDETIAKSNIHNNTNTNKGMILWKTKVPPSLWDQYKCRIVKIPLYETSTVPLCRIRKAISGIPTIFRVGTKDEDRFFVVTLATGHNGRQTPAKLYFDSPYDFEKFCCTKVDDSIKQKWRNKLQMEDETIEQ